MRIRWLAVLIGLALGVVACSPGAGSGGELEGTNWVLRSYANGGTLEIDSPRRYSVVAAGLLRRLGVVPDEMEKAYARHAFLHRLACVAPSSSTETPSVPISWSSSVMACHGWKD